ncbi:hypothetical protein BDQ17DRAFT_1413467 [Cyathus striatus]|nr:hypothetical protein BDQ17DRAFT_1413467 [Cyathus striatus]
MSQPTQTIIDDQDKSKVTYNGNWIKGGSSAEYAGTVASSTRVGDSFIVSFSGTAIAVYGTIDATSGGVQTNYTVDNAPPTQVTSQAGNGDTSHQLFYYSDVIGFADHTLNVTMVKIMPSDPGEGTIWFDYFEVENSLITNPPKKKPVAAIAGGVVGGVVGLLVIVTLFLLWRRRRNMFRWRVEVSGASEKTGDGKEQLPVIDIRRLSRPSRIQPFSLESPADPQSSYPSLSAQVNELVFRKTRVDTLQGTIADQSTHSPISPSNNTVTVASNETSTPHLTRIKAVAAAQQPPSLGTEPSSSNTNAEETTPETVLHVDSGLRAVNPDAINIPPTIVELPPVYSPV